MDLANSETSAHTLMENTSSELQTKTVECKGRIICPTQSSRSRWECRTLTWTTRWWTNWWWCNQTCSSIKMVDQWWVIRWWANSKDSIWANKLKTPTANKCSATRIASTAVVLEGWDKLTRWSLSNKTTPAATMEEAMLFQLPSSLRMRWWISPCRTNPKRINNKYKLHVIY